VAKKTYNRWRGWQAGGRRNPNAEQRECPKCRKPFVPSSDRIVLCRPCIQRLLKKRHRVRSRKNRLVA
jgi:hypothetical protein